MDAFDIVYRDASDLKVMNVDKENVLHIAAKNGHHRLVTKVREHLEDADWNALVHGYTLSTMTPLHVAIYSFHFECVETLLELGADVEA